MVYQDLTPLLKFEQSIGPRKFYPCDQSNIVSVDEIELIFSF